MTLGVMVYLQCHTYEQCQGYGQGRPVLCFSGECRYRVPCNKDNDCAFYGKFTCCFTTMIMITNVLDLSGISDMEYSIKQGYPLVAMCLKVSRPRAYGYGQCFLKPAHIVNDGE